jgi:hypothetical protein
MTSETPTQAESLLPYARWTGSALRGVVLDALEHVGREGLPGEHHFFLTFRTDHPGVEMPGHLRARFPEEMTIVLQHQFWDLRVDRAAQRFSVGLSFGGVAASLTVPLAALTAFVDPQVRFGLQFEPETAREAAAHAAPAGPPDASKPAQDGEPETQVVRLDAFRRRPSRE